MSLHIKSGGVLKDADTIHVKNAGLIKEVQSVYVKDGGIIALVYQNLIELTLENAVNLNLANWIDGQGVKANANVFVAIPAAVIIGGTVAGGYALNIGDISAYKSVHIELSGEIQAQGGSGASSRGSHALYSFHPFSLDIKSGGAIRAGGGSGGRGGSGGAGTYTAYGDWISSIGEPRYRWDQPDPNSYLRIVWADSTVYYAHNQALAPIGQNDTRTVDGWTYERATDYRWEDRYFDMRRGKTAAGVAGSGGSSGHGQGYQQSAASGSSGGTGSGGAGNGGAGGDGATWGNTGVTGTSGTAGNASAGAQGATGGGGGIAIKAVDVPIRIQNNGSIDGSTYFIAEPLV